MELQTCNSMIANFKGADQIMKKITISYPSYLNLETKMCILDTLENLGAKRIEVVDRSGEELTITFPAEKGNAILTFLNFVAIADCGGAYTEGITDIFEEL